uniref:Uncharacterized protein n=1 Tax=uncultured prokaryote TaxID=198431 RepID=A0A0H5Q607_9ZZZZ|nr:hypothetical protein [uncultured prokaryote]
MWMRLCVDVDHRGNVRGASVEVHDADELRSIWTTSIGPFDDPADALRLALRWVSENVGVQAELF